MKLLTLEWTIVMKRLISLDKTKQNKKRTKTLLLSNLKNEVNVFLLLKFIGIV